MACPRPAAVASHLAFCIHLSFATKVLYCHPGPSCHPERSEWSVRVGVEMLRGVSPERSEWAQHDKVVQYDRVD